MHLEIKDSFGQKVAVIPVPEYYKAILVAGTRVPIPTIDERAPWRVEVCQ